MKKATMQHINSIYTEELIEFKMNNFSLFASAFNDNGDKIELGIVNDSYAVKKDGEIVFASDKADESITFYRNQF